MNELSIVAIISLLFFGVLAIYFSFQEEKRKTQLEAKEKEFLKRLYELQVLSSFSEKIDDWLDIKIIAQNIALTCSQLVNLSTVSYAIVSDQTIRIKTMLKKRVSAQFLEELKNIIIRGLHASDPKTEGFEVVEFSISETGLGKSQNLPQEEFLPSSYLNIPLVISGELVGMITIASSLKNIFREEDMSVIYKIVNQSGKVVEKFKSIIETHERKREELTHILVHELRAPLTAIKGGIDLLRKTKLERSDRDKMFSIIADSTNRMLSQISDLLDAAKIEAGHFIITKKQEDLVSLIQERAEVFTPLAQSKKIEINALLDPDLPYALIDRERIIQVIDNLLSNSIKFTGVGGEIVISAQIEGKFIEVKVMDGGVGIPADKISLVFQPYTQVKTGEARGGTGLGLYISKRIVETHGGRIWIESPAKAKNFGEKRLGGTSVYFTVPIGSKKESRVTLQTSQKEDSLAQRFSHRTPGPRAQHP